LFNTAGAALGRNLALRELLVCLLEPLELVRQKVAAASCDGLRVSGKRVARCQDLIATPTSLTKNSEAFGPQAGVLKEELVRVVRVVAHALKELKGLVIEGERSTRAHQ
jgi:hypothetical protein